MITRIVKMTFLPEGVRKFERIFEKTSDLIRNYDGCHEVKLMRDTSCENIFFTVSRWKSESHLNAYRSSGLFKSTWADVKPLFSEKAEAWSLVDSIPEIK